MGGISNLNVNVFILIGSSFQNLRYQIVSYDLYFFFMTKMFLLFRSLFPFQSSHFSVELISKLFSKSLNIT